jgi:Fe-S-cluster containining protein
MDIHFGCTSCGSCCRHEKLPLTVAEAVAWLTRGHAVQVLCDAVPWPSEPAADDLPAAHRARRSAAVMSGTMPTRVTVILAAVSQTACPNLGDDQLCTIYDRRPLVCRIYPFEINPFIALNPARKACPPEAWGSDRPLRHRQGRALNREVHDDIERSRLTDERDVPIKARLCAALGYHWAALANEGFVVYSPPIDVLLAALASAAADVLPPDAPRWRFVSNQPATVAAITGVGAIGSLAGETDAPAFEYLGFRPAPT